jgi:hypothetical protein
MTPLLRSLTAVAVASCALSGFARAQTSRDPAAAKLVTEDIPRFWQAFDARATLGTAAAIDSFYIKPGSTGLKDWLRVRPADAKAFALVIDKFPGYYASARESTLRIAADEPKIRAAFVKLKALYPDAVFPDVYFLIGRLSTGGTTAKSGLLIGAEMYGRTTEEALTGLNDWLHQVLATPDMVPTIVAHELVHYQQKLSSSALLPHAVMEGSADFVAEMLTGGNFNAHVHAWVNAEPGRERMLWEEFQRDIKSNDSKPWFSPPDVKVRPKDLGYYMGYRIAQTYYETHADKAAALREILITRDAERLLNESGYAERMRTAPR